MASPYTYYYPTPYLYPYYQQPYISPFIPPIALSHSPRTEERRVRFEDDEDAFRNRRPPSWHAGMPGMAPAPGALPFPSPTMMYAPLPHMVNLAPVPPQDYMRARRRSDSYLPQPAWVAFPVQPMAYRKPSPQLHPLLDGETAGGPLLLFDISLSKFNPQRLTRASASSGTPLTRDELMQPATHPGIHHMTITCDAIPDWPITLEPHSTVRERSRERSPFLNVTAATAETAPITVYDVLMAIHRHLQRQISHVDWARLGSSDATAASRAYTRRCRTYPSADAFEASQGVRRVDYLHERFMFRGLVRSGGNNFERLKLVVGPPR